jgi:hypothetical protein
MDPPECYHEYHSSQNRKKTTQHSRKRHDCTDTSPSPKFQYAIDTSLMSRAYSCSCSIQKSCISNQCQCLMQAQICLHLQNNNAMQNKTNFHSSVPTRVSDRHEKSSSPPPPRPSPSIISTLNTNSLVSLAISNAIGGRDWFHARHARSPSSSSRPSLAMALPFSPASTRRCLICANFRTIGSPCVLSGPLAVEDMAVSVDETTVPTTSEMALIWVEMAFIPASERIEETSDWMFWTNRAV